MDIKDEKENRAISLHLTLYIIYIDSREAHSLLLPFRRNIRLEDILDFLGSQV